MSMGTCNSFLDSIGFLAMNSRTEQIEALKKAIKIAGGQAALARIASVTRQAVSLWLRTGQVPANRVQSVEAATNGLVTRHDLRPDLSRIFRE